MVSPFFSTFRQALQLTLFATGTSYDRNACFFGHSIKPEGGFIAVEDPEEDECGLESPFILSTLVVYFIETADGVRDDIVSDNPSKGLFFFVSSRLFSREDDDLRMEFCESAVASDDVL